MVLGICSNHETFSNYYYHYYIFTQYHHKVLGLPVGIFSQVNIYNLSIFFIHWSVCIARLWWDFRSSWQFSITTSVGQVSWRDYRWTIDVSQCCCCPFQLRWWHISVVACGQTFAASQSLPFEVDIHFYGHNSMISAFS